MRRVVLLGLLSVFLGACSVTAVRPAQEMSDMEVAMRAALERHADVLSPALFQSATEKSMQAKKEYRFKNFQAAQALANEARDYAEKAEFDAMKQNKKQNVVPSDPLSEPMPSGAPSE